MGIVAGASTVAVFSIIIVIICAAGGRTGLLMIYVFAVHRNDIVSERQREREREGDRGRREGQQRVGVLAMGAANLNAHLGHTQCSIPAWSLWCRTVARRWQQSGGRQRCQRLL